MIRSRTIIWASILACSALVSTGMAQSQPSLSYVDPTIGNVATLLVPTRPTVQLPHQMMRMYPLRKDFIDDQISGFPLIILSHRLGEAFSVKPLHGPLDMAGWRRPMPYDQSLEITRPWYYATWLLDDQLTVDFTPGKKTGIYRFLFEKNAPKTLLFSTLNNGEGEWKFISGKEITGIETYHGDIKVYMYGRFNASGTSGTVKDGRLSVGSTSATGKNCKSWIAFPSQTADTIEFRYAISFISPEQAHSNFEEELSGTPAPGTPGLVADIAFDQLKQKGQAAWEKVIGQIHVEGGTEAQKRSFYSALYRCNERMVDISEDHRYYSGFDKMIHTDNGRPFYVDDWIWDTYLALHPLRAILDPVQEKDMVDSYVTMYDQSGWMPTFPVLFGDHACMNGFHSSIMILDDYRKGIRPDNPEKAYEGMLKNATQATMLPWRNGPKTALDDVYYTKGFFPALHEGDTETVSEVHPGERRQAVAVTLGGSYDDWAVAQMAKELDKTSDYQTFSKRADNYKQLWNANDKMFLPKDDKGNWIPIDPKFAGGKGGRDYYDENNGWTYLWQVQEDIPGLIRLMGGKDAFEARLDQLFREDLGRSKSDFWYTFPDATGLVGQYSMGNEPSFHIPYLYNFTNAPWKTQERVRFLLDLWFKDNVFGIPGDEDGGGMSAFVVFSSMGFYPVTPGIPVYTIGSPVFSKITIDLPGGKQFSVIANNYAPANKYVQHARLNGQDLSTPWFTHRQLQAGGILELEMGSKPNKQWGVMQ